MSETAMASPDAHFHPHRLYPSFGPAFATASRISGGLTAVSRILGSVAFDPAGSDTENARPEDLAAAEVVVCGFPRTGTTFIQNAVTSALDDERACWKNHDPLAVRRYAHAGIPTWLTLREPASTVVSWSLYHRDVPSTRLLARRLAVYAAWHREALRLLRLPGVVIIDFDEFAADPASVILRQLGHATAARVSASLVSAHIRATNDLDNRDLHQSNTPDPRRELLKEPYWQLLADRRLQRPLREAQRTYAALSG